jgi:hypothetical protein
MSLDLVLDRRVGIALALSLLVFYSSGCGTVRNPALERARNAYERARKDPEVAGRAAVALDQTRLTLEQAEHVWATEKDVTEVEHLVYLTEKRAEIARVIARRRLASDEIQKLKSQRE